MIAVRSKTKRKTKMTKLFNCDRVTTEKLRLKHNRTNKTENFS